MFTAAVAGHVCVDLIPELNTSTDILPGQLLDIGPLDISAGGCVANTGGALVDLGVNVTVSGSVGDDHLGGTLRQLFQTRGLNPHGLSIERGATTSYSIVVEKPGMNRSFWHHVGANALFNGTNVDLEGVDLLHVGYPPLLPALTADGGTRLIDLFSRARSLGVTTSLDMAVVDQDSMAGSVDWREFLKAVLPLTDVFSPSVDDLTSALQLDSPPGREPLALAIELADALVDQGAGVAVLSAGSDGLVLSAGGSKRLTRGGAMLARLASSWANARTHAPAVAVDHVITTNGAGDVASAGLLHALASGTDPDGTLEHAAAVAAARVSGRDMSTVSTPWRP